MKARDLLLPLLMLAFGVGLGFWAREPHHPQAATRADAAPAMVEARNELAATAAQGTQATPSASSTGQPAATAAFALPPADAKVIDIYDALKTRALGGDAAAACRLAYDLAMCDRMPTGPSASRLDPDEVSNAKSEADLQRYDFVARFEQKRLQAVQRCGGITDLQLADSAQMLYRAARAGHVPSMVAYVLDGGVSENLRLHQIDDLRIFKREAPGMLHAAARAGSLEAVSVLATLHPSSFSLLPIEQAYVGRIDPVQSYSHQLLLDMAFDDSAESPERVELLAEERRQMKQARDRTEATLSEAQVTAAKRLAAERFESWFGGKRAKSLGVELVVEMSMFSETRPINTICSDGPWTEAQSARDGDPR